MEAVQMANRPVYIRIHLSTREVDGSTRRALETLGVGDIEEAEPYTAYAIVDNDIELFNHISGCHLVKSIERRDPPTGM